MILLLTVVVPSFIRNQLWEVSRVRMLRTYIPFQHKGYLLDFIALSPVHILKLTNEVRITQKHLDDPRPALKSLSIDQVRGQYCVPGGQVAEKNNFLELNSQWYWWTDGNRCVGSFWIPGCSDRLSDGWNVAGSLE